MTISIVGKLIRGPILLASAGFLLNTGSALAAGNTSDAQAQARELLARTPNRSPAVATSIAFRAGMSHPDFDPQEHARRLILGTPRSALNSKTSGPAPRRIRSAYPDAHALAERMITGKTG